ncbi:PD-(D/E)XK nuclease family protein [uncultured Ilyobacter sp.]|uniref:PD-(D/E)XK nuclease family protein n=1 Tax=uncultured Ilyobacter sp. TaxID=544433 RepID=UPI0029C90728|nr:PD-(D/E)XK nuclease family protein [uncultured Ilyobacter sp.]
MKFTYVEYGKDILKGLKNDGKSVFVFSDNSLKNNAEERSEESFFRRNSLYTTISSMKETLLPEKRLVIREEKRTLLFYRAIPEDIKQKYNINSYYDIIDLGENFLKFYGELREHFTEDLKNLQKWQIEYLEDLESIKGNYIRLLDKYKYIPQDWANDLSNYSPYFFEKYEKFVFIDIPFFSPLEKKIVEKLSDNFEIEFLLQMAEGDFCEQELKIKKFTFPEKSNNIEVIQVSDDMHQLVNLIDIMKEDSIELFSQSPENSIYPNFAPRIFTGHKNILKNTNLYRFMELQYEILSGITTKIYSYDKNQEKTLYFSTQTILNALENRIFSDYYTINQEDNYFFSKIIENEYQYITKKIITDDELLRVLMDRKKPSEETESKIFAFLGKLSKIIEDICRISEVSGAGELIDLMGKEDFFRFSELDEDIYVDSINKYFESLSEVKSLEMLDMHTCWEDYFGKSKAEPLYKLLLKYMQLKEVKLSPRNDLTPAKIKSAGDESSFLKEKAVYIDVSGKTLPGKNTKNFLLTEVQREENGLLSSEEMRLKEKYRFFQSLFNCKRAWVFSMKNEENDLDSSPFIEELMLNYGLNITKSKYEQRDVLSMARSLFKGGSIANRKPMENSLPKCDSDFSEGIIKLGSYDYSLLTLCPYKYYLQNIASLSRQIRETESKLSPRTIGIIIHEVMEEIASQKKEEIKNKNFSLEHLDIEGILRKSLSKRRLQIPFHLDNYYREVMFPVFLQGIKGFYKNIEKTIGDQDIRSFAGEKSKKVKLIDEKLKVVLSGRIDLIIEGDRDNYILDYKTGQGDPRQLDFYSILYYGEENKAKKYIFNAWDGKLEDYSDRKNPLTSDDMKEQLGEFISHPSYKRTEKHSTCNGCEYQQVCRMRWENEE